MITRYACERIAIWYACVPEQQASGMT